ncbi:integrase core domain-containing protein [Mycolicibacterium goodii]|uniref:integrase core domain-containing protein n=2 Tax=Mycolicibacterium goodii TaxID=134601 RepID=UPI0027E1F361|nr:integrase core domain-containing protein [Mycolicibacterium goodii]
MAAVVVRAAIAVHGPYMDYCSPSAMWWEQLHQLACSAWQLKRRFIKPGRPWTNGEAERFNRTSLTEWAHVRPWISNSLRARGVDRFLHRHNTYRGPTALGGRPPTGRAPDLSGDTARTRPSRCPAPRRRSPRVPRCGYARRPAAR